MKKIVITVPCPNCKKPVPISPGSLLGSIKSKKRSKAARENGKKGGRPKAARDTKKAAMWRIGRAQRFLKARLDENLARAQELLSEDRHWEGQSIMRGQRALIHEKE